MIDLWWEEARRHNVLPLDDRGRERFIDPTRPAASEDRDVYRYYPGTHPVPNPALPRILNCRHALTAHATLGTEADEGLLACQGAELGGWALFVKDGRVRYVHNVLRIEFAEVASVDPLPVGREIAIRVEYEPIEQGWGRVRLLIDGAEVGVNERMRIAPMGYSMVQEGFVVGRGWGPPVAYNDYEGAFPFTGSLRVVELETDFDSQVWTPRGEWSTA